MKVARKAYYCVECTAVLESDESYHKKFIARGRCECGGVLIYGYSENENGDRCDNTGAPLHGRGKK